jgi:hypothetical protein
MLQLGTAQIATKPGFLELLNQIQSQYGLIVLILVLLLAFFCFLLWKLIWKVWSAAMKAKDDEIKRISKERDKYQTLVFKRLKSSEVDKDNGKK